MRQRLRIALADALITTMGSASRAITVLTRALEAAETLDDIDARMLLFVVLAARPQNLFAGVRR